MKQLILFSVLWLLVAAGNQGKAQEDRLKTGKQYFEMGEFFRWGESYDKRDYDRAVKSYRVSASLGYPDGIMALGEMYQFGLGGLKKDVDMAFKLVWKAYLMGSGRACYNLGKSYAYGLGCEVDYKKMISYFEEGIKRGDGASMDAMGNMLFKGWGVEQSYEKAIAYFEKAAALNYLSAKYYLGLCYRNGFGVKKDVQKGKELLEEASLMCYSARKELKKSLPEVDAANKVDKKEFEAPGNYATIKHNATAATLDGEWAGYLAFYDWSGKIRLSEEKVEVSFKVDGDRFAGVWTLGGANVAISGINNQYGIVFNSGEFDYVDRYFDNVKLKINTGSLELFTQGSKTILAGNISLFSQTAMAPERPAWIVLVNKKEKKEKSAEIAGLPKVESTATPVVQESNSGLKPELTGIAQNSSVGDQVISRLQESAINSRVWPVPFQGHLSVEYNLPAAAGVEIRLVSIDGKSVNLLSRENRQAGLQTQQFEVAVPTGTYVLQILAEGRKASHVIIRK